MKTYRDKGLYIVSDQEKINGNYQNVDEVLVDRSKETRFRYGRPMVFESIEEANEFLDTPIFEEESIYCFKFKNYLNVNGKYAIYKKGGFSGDMCNENRHKQYGWHMVNFPTKMLAKKYLYLGNMSLQLGNNGGGYYIMRIDDKTSKPIYK